MATSSTMPGVKPGGGSSAETQGMYSKFGKAFERADNSSIRYKPAVLTLPWYRRTAP